MTLTPMADTSELREKIAKLIRYHVSVTTSHHGQSYALENVDDAADAILALIAKGDTP